MIRLIFIISGLLMLGMGPLAIIGILAILFALFMD